MNQAFISSNNTQYNITKAMLKNALDAFKQLPPYQQQQMIQEIAQEEVAKYFYAAMQQYRW